MAFSVTDAKVYIAYTNMSLITGCNIISCARDFDWRILFDRPFTYIDALKMTFGELSGSDYSYQARYEGREFYQPIWHKDLLETKTLVIDNLAEVPPQSDTDVSPSEDSFGEERPGQVDYLFMCRYPNEPIESRALNYDSSFLIDTDIAVFIIRRANAAYQIIENIMSRASFLSISESKD